MAKTLNQFLEGYLKVKNPDEQKFVDKHVTAKHSDRNGNDDGAFKGKTKQIDRRKERHGYNPGEDEKVYEELKGGQVKLDKNHNGKLDAHDFKLLRKKKIAEGMDKVVDNGHTPIGRATQHAAKLISSHTKRKHYFDGGDLVDHETDKTVVHNAASKPIHVVKKLAKDYHAGVKEEVEELEELSTNTIRNYLKKDKEVGDKLPHWGGRGYRPGRDPSAHHNARATARSKLTGEPQEHRGKTDKDGYSQSKGHIKAKILSREEAEQIDELSTPTLRKYREKARLDAFDANDVDDERRLRKRSFGHNQAGKKIIKRGDTLRAEEAEQIDELSHATLRRYRMKSKAIGDNEKGDIGYRSKGRDLAARKTHGGQWGIPKAKVMAKEEAEDLDEAKKKIVLPGRPGWDEYVKNRNAKAKRFRDAMNTKLPDHKDPDAEYEKARHKAANPRMESVEQIDELSKNTVRSYYNKAGDQGREIMGKMMVGGGDWSKDEKDTKTLYKRGKGRQMALKRRRGEVKMSEEAEQIDEKLTAKTPMGTYIKDFQKSDAPQFKGKSQEKRRVMAIAAKLTAERGGKPLRKEEKLVELLGDLTESHRRTMLSVFDKLNEDNQKKFLEACGTPEGVEQMLDFSISHRGE